ncbi:MAG TPA: hypothetical protein VFP65_18030 [Anaeromyxobacteraceae bacterium]|nr:hypothetical protein [Anaeromyxobacteraceae bacterium]
MRFDGGCHCGNLQVTFETSRAPDAFQLRRCGCTFCTRHGQVSVTDPAGKLEVRVRDPGAVSRYQFGLRTSEFMICRTCGVFVTALCTIDGATYATLNVNTLADRSAFTQPPVPVDFDAENAEQRLARRRRAWTPAVVSPLLA